jgi:hypothetical protein
MGLIQFWICDFGFWIMVGRVSPFRILDFGCWIGGKDETARFDLTEKIS